MRVAELQALAGSMGITVSPKMRKADLVEAIRSRGEGASQNGKSAGTQRDSGTDGRSGSDDASQTSRQQGRGEDSQVEQRGTDGPSAEHGAEAAGQRPQRRSRRVAAAAGAPAARRAEVDSPTDDAAQESPREARDDERQS